ncbi:toprim domain-containing protein [Xanthocytophaga flava]|uniref:toprim domain-containing protein n=1 Tax=Xanthocytophaga flava TaxID=3048013 RepID=UPI0028D1945C|nr:toprim domain-containing protein [Xanthocytophaga flavus]MDJ1470269.1 toprim domain-containing protein [Xanthocytophaga flavus]
MIQKLSSPEQEKVTALFNKFGVEYMAVGDYALRKYVDGRYFNNIQLWVKPTPENFKKVEDAFASVRRKLNVDEKAFTTENSDVPLTKIGRGHKSVELLTGVAGLSADNFNQIFSNRKVLNAGEVPVPVLNEKDLHKSIQKSNHTNQKTDLLMLERAYPGLNTTNEKQVSTVQAVDWKQAAKTMDPHRLLQDLGYKHIPAKGLFGSSKSQTYERGDEKITVYPNPTTKSFFIDHTNGKKGDAIDVLNWHHEYDRKKVNAYIKDHFNGLAPVQSFGQVQGNQLRKTVETATPPIDEKKATQMQGELLKENYGLKNSLNKPEYLQSRSLSLSTIFRPEFFKQVLNSLGWSSKDQKQVNIDNTAFPMRNDHGINSMIIRNQNFKGQSEGERKDAIWLSNPPLTLGRDIKIPVGDKSIVLPKGTEGSLIAVADKPGHFQFYFNDLSKAGKDLPYNKVEVSGKALTQLTAALNPLKVDRLMITENPIDAMSFHQISPPKQGESRMYISTGGQPSDKQLAYINQIVQRVEPSQVILGNDNEKAGTKFNINLMGAIHHPSSQNQFIARIHETSPKSIDNKVQDGNNTAAGEYNLKLFGAKDPKEMEKIALSITDSINRHTPKGQQPPARVTFLNGSPEAGTEVTIAFPKNDRFLQAAQKSMEKIINEGAGEQQVMKVVKPQAKDFNEDLQVSKKEGRKISYDLGELPSTVKIQSKNLLQQVSGYFNNAFDALFGGVPGSLPRVEETRIEKSRSVEQSTSQRSVVESSKVDVSKQTSDLTKDVSKKETSTIAETTKVDLTKKGIMSSADITKSDTMKKAAQVNQPPSSEKSQVLTGKQSSIPATQEKKKQEETIKSEEKVEKVINQNQPLKQPKSGQRMRM